MHREGGGGDENFLGGGGGGRARRRREDGPWRMGHEDDDTQRLKNHSDEPPSILAWTFRGLLSPAPDPWAIAHAAGGRGARCQVALTYH